VSGVLRDVAVGILLTLPLGGLALWAFVGYYAVRGARRAWRALAGGEAA
jgi:hypothetical protein